MVGNMRYTAVISGAWRECTKAEYDQAAKDGRPRGRSDADDDATIVEAYRKRLAAIKTGAPDPSTKNELEAAIVAKGATP
jgi:hypothetical protein